MNTWIDKVYSEMIEAGVRPVAAHAWASKQRALQTIHRVTADIERRKQAAFTAGLVFKDHWNPTGEEMEQRRRRHLAAKARAQRMLSDNRGLVFKTCWS
jgi:hypothetical protein